MRYTETISISWHTFAGEKPRPHKDIVVKRYGANTLFAPKDVITAENVPQALTRYDPHDEWAYADEIKDIKSDGSILRSYEFITRDNVNYFTVLSVSQYIFDYDSDNYYENVTAEVVLKDGTKIPFDVPVFKDPYDICHSHTLFYNGNRYVIDIMLNNDDPTHKDKYRAVIRRCNGPESPVFVYGEVLAFYQEK